MIRVKALSAGELEDLETELNDFFESVGNRIELIDVKYAIAHHAVTTDPEAEEVYSDFEYTAMVIYKDW